jgi:hypothetical protein
MDPESGNLSYTHKIACSIEFEFQSDEKDWRTALDEVMVEEIPLKDLTTAEKWEWFEEQAPGRLDDYLVLIKTTNSPD